MELLVEQCELGSRAPGSEGNRLLQDLIIHMADEAAMVSRKQCFSFDDPMGSGRIEACNIVVSTPTQGEGARLWLGAHFDSRPVSDLDSDPARRSEPLTGANDGASGVAVLLHLIEILAESPPVAGVDLIFFDAEDSGHSGAPAEFCLGSQRLASTLSDFSNPLVGVQPRGLIVLDMIGDRDLRLPMEGYSLRYAPEWTQEVFARALELGLPAFVAERGASVYDDHVPFLLEGIPAVDLIDFEYPPWHTTGDVPAACSSSSLEQVGCLLIDLIYRP
jgi:peptidase M28-like protein